MSKASDWIRKEHEKHQKLLAETPEEAHTHTLSVRRCESHETFIREHVPDNVYREEILGHFARIKQLIGPALTEGHKEHEH